MASGMVLLQFLGCFFLSEYKVSLTYFIPENIISKFRSDAIKPGKL